MGLIGKLLSLFGGGSKTAEPEPEPKPEPEEEAEGDEEEEEADDGMSTKAVAEMADPRRREDEKNTVRNRAKNPEDHAPAEEPEAEAEGEDEAEAEGDEEKEDDGGMSTKAVAEMADPRRHEDEENTVHNRAKNPDDQRAT
ncbi:hypothetical protein [Haloplanus natans]|uniref:hypothetical protein n=1 Tax=Haloplanus natans TaxID=376171 RepID=UPI00067765BB|nr:hypothetical protein [Haloplanus natans]